MSDTPLSDRITLLVADWNAAVFTEFLVAFLDAYVGLFVSNLPDNIPPGADYRIRENDNVQSAPVTTPDGRLVIKVCADPIVFAKQKPDAVNCWMRGRDVLEMSLKVPQIEGVLVCSAASFHSIPIGREHIVRLLGNTPRAVPPDTRW